MESTGSSGSFAYSLLVMFVRTAAVLRFTTVMPKGWSSRRMGSENIQRTALEAP